VLTGVPRALPALLRAHEISTRAAAVGFDWPTASNVMDKIEEEVRELRAALDENPARAAEELGDLLFALSNLSRKLASSRNPPLRAANDKFTTRFGLVEDHLAARGRTVHDSTLDEMEAAWQQVKAAETKPSSSAVPARSGSTPSRRRSRR
jgi:ATP diphosphatase